MALILLVDDSLDDLLLMQEFILNIGFKSRIAHSAIQALEIFEEESFDLVISDYHLGNEDGEWLIKEIKKLNQNVKSMIITSDRSKNMNSFEHLELNGFLHRPIDWEKLKTFVMSIL